MDVLLEHRVKGEDIIFGRGGLPRQLEPNTARQAGSVFVGNRVAERQRERPEPCKRDPRLLVPDSIRLDLESHLRLVDYSSITLWLSNSPGALKPKPSKGPLPQHLLRKKTSTPRVLHE
jgi:hypothetical protein